MTLPNWKTTAAMALLSGTCLLSFLPSAAKADLFCYPWEGKSCKVDGRIGTSGNDILGIGGGDTVQKAAMAADAYFGTGGAISGTVKTVYEPIKRPILDAVGDALITEPSSQPSRE